MRPQVDVVGPSKLYIGCNVRHLRENAGIAVAEMASHLGLTTDEYLNREDGEVDFTIVELFRVSLRVGATLEQILTDDGSGSPRPG